MATEWISPTWRMPEESNQSKLDNYSLDFDGTNDFITCGNISELNGTTEATWYGWFNRSSSGSYYIMSTWDTSAANGQFTPVQSPTALTVYMSSSAGQQKTMFQNTSLTFDTGTWYHLAFVYNESEASDSDKLKVYINSVIQTNTAAGAALTSLNSSTASFEIGKIGGYTSSKFTGDIGQVGVYDTALTSPQITALYNSGTPVNPMALTPLPIAYYPLGGSSTGSSSTLTIPNESVPSATVFDFDNLDGTSNDFIDINSLNSNILNSSFTISLWLKKELKPSYTDNDRIIDLTVDANTSLQIICDNNSQKFAINFILSGVSKVNQQGFNSWASTSNKWNQIVFTWDGSSYVYYFNGQPVSSTGPVSIGVAGTGFFLGKRADGNLTTFYNGQMSNVQVWNAELESSDVTTLYNNGVPFTGTQPQAANLKAWWKMNVDTSTWDGSDWIIGEAQANYSSALSFDGADTVDLPDITFLRDGGQNFSISAWVNTTSGTQVGYFGTRVAPSVTNTINFYRNTNGALIFGINNSSTGNIVATGTSSALTNNKWYHIAATFDGTEGTAADRIKLYINGELDANSTSGTGTNLPSGSTGIFNTIGKIFIGILQAGDMSNVGIWSSTLEASAITALYNNGTPEASISSSPQAWWKLDSTTITDSSGNGNNGTNSGTTVTDIQVSTLNGTSSGMTTANLVNSDLTRSIPYSSYSMVFDGTDDYILTGSAIDLGTSCSISFWYSGATSGRNGSVVGGRSFAEGGLPSNYQTIFLSAGTYLAFYQSNSATPKTFIYGSSPMNSSDWFHAVIVRDGANLNLYLNGADTSTSYTDLDATAPTYVRNIATNGENQTGSQTITGKISNVSLYNSVLTEDQILTIYNGGVPNDISSLSPVSWWSLSGDSYYDGTNWICPDLGSTGNNGTSANMAGTELVGDGPGSTANGIATSMDIPANLKGNAPNSSKNAFSINMNSADRVEDVPA